MGEDNKKSFWTSLPGILTGVAAVITAIGGIIAAHNIIAPPPSKNTTPPPAPTPPTHVNDTGNSPAFVKVIVRVNNTGGGMTIPSDFNVVVYGDTNANPGMFDGSEKGTIVAMHPGAYSLSVNPKHNSNTTYGTSYSGHCALKVGWYDYMGGAIIRAGENQICTITETFPNFK